MASTTSRVWYAIASTPARARWAAVVPRVMPTIVPRAYGIPPRAAQPRERRDQVDALGVGARRRERAHGRAVGG